MSQELIIKDSGIIARAELDVQISTAKAYPRDAKRSIQYAIDLATMDEETAQSCFYCLPRKEKDGTRKEIKGGSIRLAEIVANAWGNIHAATRIVENDGRHITAEGVAWDLETNVKIAMQNKVSIRFGGKDGKSEYTANADLQTVLSNAASAKALRNSIFKVIPKALIDRVLDAAMNFSIGDTKTINAKVQEIFDKLNKMGLQKEKILEYYGRKSISEITPEEYRSLIGLGTAIKDKVIKPEDAFTVENEESTSLSAAEKINSLIAGKKSEKVNPKTGEINPTPLSLDEQIKKQIESAKSLDTLHLAADLIKDAAEDKQDELRSLYKEKESQLK